MAWLDNYAKPRSAKSVVGDMSDEDDEEITDAELVQSDGESDKDLSPQSVAVTSTKNNSSTLQKKQKVKHKQNQRVRGGKMY